MATFNGAQYVLEQLKSFNAQTRLPDELIVFDDNSGDGTASLLRSFESQAKFPVRTIINDNNIGYAKNFSAALIACKGDVVFLSDQDDVWLPNKIERVLKVFEQNTEAELVIHDLEFCDKDLTPIGQTKLERMALGHNVVRDYVVGMATAIRGEFLRLCLPIPETPGLAHDRWLHDCALAIDGKIVLDEVLALYRRHGCNATAGAILNSPMAPNWWSYYWAKLKEPSLLKMLPEIPPSPLLVWISVQGDVLQKRGYLDDEALEKIIAHENRKAEIMRARARLLKRPRFLRVAGVARLLFSGAYAEFFSLKSALKDLIIS